MVISRLGTFLREQRLVVALIVVGLVIATGVGFAAGSVESAGYVGAILGVFLGMVIAYSQRRRERAAAERNKGKR